MTDAKFLQEVKRCVCEIDPQARADSDWDFLVLTDQSVDWVYKRRMRDHLYEFGLDTERVISPVIKNKVVWVGLGVTDLYQAIQEEGLVV